MAETLLTPNWPAPDNVVAFTTLRTGGFSDSPYDSFNLAVHVGDDMAKVSKNRALLKQQLGYMPIWLEQTHSTNVRVVDCLEPVNSLELISTAQTDGAIAFTKNTVCCVMTADCLPVLLTDPQGSFVCALHAGWRGLANGIITKALEQITSARKNGTGQVLAWLGPAIGPLAFEVGDEVKAIFTAKDSNNAEAFKVHGQKWLCDIYHLARVELERCGVSQIFGGEYCTFTDQARFFSYRRNGVTGRMASGIYIR